MWTWLEAEVLAYVCAFVGESCLKGPEGNVSQQAYWVRAVAPVCSCDSRRIRSHKDSVESTECRAGRAQCLHFCPYITHTHTLRVSPLSAGLFLEWAFAAPKYIQECVHVCVHVLMGCTDALHECTLALLCGTSAEAARGRVRTEVSPAADAQKLWGLGPKCLITSYLAVNARLGYLWWAM